MPATRRKTLTDVERSSSESSLYTASGTSYMATDSDASSSSPAPSQVLALKQRRTRKRISAQQLAALENLFTRATHPSQQDREILARALHMEVKNVTIWFQNRRQAARKIALHEAITHSNSLNMSIGHRGLLGEAHLRGRASPVTPEQIGTPPGNDEQFSIFASSCPSPAVADPTWHSRSLPHITKNDQYESNDSKGALDAEMFAAALALAEMRSVDSPAA